MLTLVTVNFPDGSERHPDQRFESFAELAEHVRHNYSGFSSFVVIALARD